MLFASSPHTQCANMEDDEESTSHIDLGPREVCSDNLRGLQTQTKWSNPYVAREKLQLLCLEEIEDVHEWKRKSIRAPMRTCMSRGMSSSMSMGIRYVVLCVEGPVQWTGEGCEDDHYAGERGRGVSFGECNIPQISLREGCGEMKRRLFTLMDVEAMEVQALVQGLLEGFHFYLDDDSDRIWEACMQLPYHDKECGKENNVRLHCFDHWQRRKRLHRSNEGRCYNIVIKRQRKSPCGYEDDFHASPICRKKKPPQGPLDNTE